MLKLRMTKMLVLVGMLLIGGSWATLSASDGIRPLETILSDLERHIAELTLNIEKMSERMELLRETPPTDDPVIQELRVLDLKGWELHDEQWRLQLKHLKYAEEVLRAFHTSSGDKSQLSAQWRDHEREYESALDTYRNKRHAIERERLQKEGKMIERYLR